ncbi:MAG: hypothetical protein JNJ48_08600 [Phycisphaerae bacterium]|nr:hypothetical protein [Phycisphaerae bacterium]
MRTGDIRIGNVLARRRASLFRKLRAAGDRGREALVPFFKHEQADVRVEVAAWLLRYRTADALEILRRESKGEGLVSFEAAQAIKRWEEGTWRLDPPEQ